MKQGGALTVKIVYSSFVAVTDAGVAQLVELHVANVVVAGSSPVSRSSKDRVVIGFSVFGPEADVQDAHIDFGRYVRFGHRNIATWVYFIKGLVP